MKNFLLLLTAVLAIAACSSETKEVLPVGTIPQSPSDGLERTLTVEELADFTDLVVKAEVIQSEYVEDKISPPNATFEGQTYTNKFFLVQVEIESYLKGSAPSTITVVTNAGLRDDPDSKTSVLTPGRQYILFLTSTEKDGYWEGNYLTSFQGRWHILPDNTNKVAQESSLKVVDTGDFIEEIKSFR